MNVTIGLATRGRPMQLGETIRRTLPNIVRPDTKLVVLADEDDIETIASEDEWCPGDARVKVSIRQREDTNGPKHDRVLTEYPADLYLTMHDCAPILTPGFDQAVVDAAALFGDGIGVINGPMANASFPAMQTVTAKWVEIVGYRYAHDYPYWFIDHELDDLARMTGRQIYLPIELSIAQMRPTKTIRLRDLRWWMDYFDTGVYRRRAKARKIIEALDEPEHRKEMLRTWYMPVEARSFAIHAGLRPHAAAVEKDRGEGGFPDQGYLRAFDNARVELIKMEVETRQLFAEAA